MILRGATGRGALGGRLELPLLEALAGTLAHRQGHGLQVPDHAQKGHELQQVERDVELPPVEALAGRRGIVVMIVVPALAQGDDREPGVVAAPVAGLVPLPAEYVGQRVDRVAPFIPAPLAYKHSTQAPSRAWDR